MRMDLPRIVLIGLQILHRRKFGDEHGVVIVLADAALHLAAPELGNDPEKPLQSGEELLLLALRPLAELPHHDMTDHFAL